MNQARRGAAELRLSMGLHGKVDAEALANRLGLVIVPWPMGHDMEARIGNIICVAEHLEPEWRRWVIAHSIGHRFMHPGNHPWIWIHTSLGPRLEREAEDFACALLVDGREAAAGCMVQSWQVAVHFGVPDEMVRLRARHVFESQSIGCTATR